MDKLSSVSTADLRDEFEQVTTAKATKRLLVAIAYKDGVSVETLSDRYGIPRSTLYSWLERFESMPIDEALHDEDRPGRPPELTAAERDSLKTDLARSPTAFGYDDSRWTPPLVRTHIQRRYRVSYSLGHVRRLVRELNVELD